MLKSYKFTIPSDANDYDYKDEAIRMQRSEACLEGSFMDQMNFLGELQG